MRSHLVFRPLAPLGGGETPVSLGTAMRLLPNAWASLLELGSF